MRGEAHHILVQGVDPDSGQKPGELLGKLNSNFMYYAYFGILEAWGSRTRVSCLVSYKMWDYHCDCQ